MLYCPDRKTQLGMIFPANNIELTANFNSISEITFTVPRTYFDVKTGRYVETQYYNDLKPQMVVEINAIEEVFSVPVYDSDGNITSNKKIDLEWWVINSTDETYDGVSLKKKVTCYSYEHTLKRRTIALSASEGAGATSYALHTENGETIYAIQAMLPNDGTYFKTSFGKTDSNGNFVSCQLEDGSVMISITKSQLAETNETSISRYLANQIILQLYTDSHRAKRSNGSVCSASLNTEIKYINSLIDKYSEDNGVSKEYYIVYTTYKSITGLIKNEAPSWRFGSISPNIKTSYSYIEDTSTNAYDLLMTTVSKNFECFPVFDNTNLVIHLLSKTDYVGQLKSGFHLGWNNCIKESSINTEQNEPCTALAVYSENTSDYDMGLINPTGDNIIYNFGEYTDYMSEELQSKCAAWTHKLSMFDVTSEKVGYWIAYYTQQKQRLYTKVAEALEDYCDVASQINAYLEDDGTNTIKMTETFYVSSNLTSYGWYKPINENNENAGKNAPYSYPYLYNKYQTWNDALVDKTEHKKRFHSIGMLKRLLTKSKKYYSVRLQYDIAAFKYYVANFYRKSIYLTTKLNNNTYIGNEYKDFINSSFLNSPQNTYGMYRKMFCNKGGFKNVLSGLSDIYTEVVEGYASLANGTISDISQNSFPDIYHYCKGFPSETISNYFDIPEYSKRDGVGVAHFDSSLENFGAEYRKDIDKYIMNGVYTNSEIRFPDISDISNSGVIRNNTDLVINGLKELKRSAKTSHKTISATNYEFSVSPVNFILMHEYKDMLKHLFLGGIIKAEVSPDCWQEAYLLSIKLNYDNPSDIEMTFSNNYDMKPLKYRFADLYNQVSANTSISNTFTADLYD